MSLGRHSILVYSLVDKKLHINPAVIQGEVLILQKKKCTPVKGTLMQI